jgi:hypothetical protein
MYLLLSFLAREDLFSVVASSAVVLLPAPAALLRVEP